MNGSSTAVHLSTMLSLTLHIRLRGQETTLYEECVGSSGMGGSCFTVDTLF